VTNDGKKILQGEFARVSWVMGLEIDQVIANIASDIYQKRCVCSDVGTVNQMLLERSFAYPRI
jgi:hypothetical protein